MAAVAQLRCSPLPRNYHLPDHRPASLHSPEFLPSLSFPSSSPHNLSIAPLHASSTLNPNLLGKLNKLYAAGGSSSGGGLGRGSGGGGGDSGGWSSGEDSDDSSARHDLGFLGLLLNGWRSRVAADPQFPFKVLMEELVGVSACVLGDMASRPNFGLNELDFVFSTLVVGSIMNFVLMYILAPTASGSVSALPGIFASCPKSHMFEPGAYGLLSRLGTLVYKGTLFAAVGFSAGLVGTAISNGLIKMKKKMDPNFETPNKPPPTLLNALTWAIQMGVSSNLRYQTLNGIEFLLAKGVPPLVFKSSVLVLRCLNNVVGGMSFVLLAKLTGSQSAAAAAGEKVAVLEAGSAAANEKLVDSGEDLPNSQSTK